MTWRYPKETQTKKPAKKSYKLTSRVFLATFVFMASLLTKSFSIAFKRSLPAPSFATKWLLHHDCWWCTSPPCHASAALFPGFQLWRRWWHPPVGRTVLRPNRHRLWLHGWALVRPSLERWWATNLPSCLWSCSRTATKPGFNKHVMNERIRSCHHDMDSITLFLINNPQAMSQWLGILLISSPKLWESDPRPTNVNSLH